MNRGKGERRNGMLVPRVMFIKGIAFVTLVNFDSFAWAQNNPQPSPPADMQSTGEPPMNQLQPTFRVQPVPSDLPPGAESELKSTEAQKQFDKTLQICRNC
jgi:hypothetical protein